jgi:hypothetical protein
LRAHFRGDWENSTRARFSRLAAGVTSRACAYFVVPWHAAGCSIRIVGVQERMITRLPVAFGVGEIQSDGPVHVIEEIL